MVKTYQLREKDEAGLVEELNKNKVNHTLIYLHIAIIYYIYTYIIYLYRMSWPN